MADLQDVVDELRGLRAMVRLAFADQLAAAIGQVEEDDPVAGSILSEATHWVSSTELQQRVARQTGKSTRTVRERLPMLIDMGLLMADGTERRMRYKRREF